MLLLKLKNLILGCGCIFCELDIKNLFCMLAFLFSFVNNDMRTFNSASCVKIVILFSRSKKDEIVSSA